MVLITISILLPTIGVLNYLNVLNHKISTKVWLLYILVFNTVMLVWIPKVLASSVAYPFSNSFVKRRQYSQSNTRFGLEFKRCIERMTRMIKETTER